MATLFTQTLCTYSIELFANYSSSSQLQDSLLQYTGRRNLDLSEQKRIRANNLCRKLQTTANQHISDENFKLFALEAIQTSLDELNALCVTHQMSSGSLEPLLHYFQELTEHTFEIFERHQLLQVPQALAYEDALIILKKNLSSYLIKNKAMGALSAHKAEYGWLRGQLSYYTRKVGLAKKKETLIEDFLSGMAARINEHPQKSGAYNNTVLTIIDEIRKNNNIIREANSFKGNLPVSLGSVFLTLHIPTEFKHGQGTLEDYLTDAENKITSLSINKKTLSSAAARSSLTKPKEQQLTSRIPGNHHSAPSQTTNKNQNDFSILTSITAAAAPLFTQPQPAAATAASAPKLPPSAQPVGYVQTQMSQYDFTETLSQPRSPTKEQSDFEKLSALYGLTEPD